MVFNQPGVSFGYSGGPVLLRSGTENPFYSLVGILQGGDMEIGNQHFCWAIPADYIIDMFNDLTTYEKTKDEGFIREIAFKEENLYFDKSGLKFPIPSQPVSIELETQQFVGKFESPLVKQLVEKLEIARLIDKSEFKHLVDKDIKCYMTTKIELHPDGTLQATTMLDTTTVVGHLLGFEGKVDVFVCDGFDAVLWQGKEQTFKITPEDGRWDLNNGRPVFVYEVPFHWKDSIPTDILLKASSIRVYQRKSSDSLKDAAVFMQKLDVSELKPKLDEFNQKLDELKEKYDIDDIKKKLFGK